MVDRVSIGQLLLLDNIEDFTFNSHGQFPFEAVELLFRAEVMEVKKGHPCLKQESRFHPMLADVGASSVSPLKIQMANKSTTTLKSHQQTRLLQTDCTSCLLTTSSYLAVRITIARMSTP